MPNLIAQAALALWPVVAAMLFRALPPGRALIATLLAGYLLLPPPPAGFDLPLLPALTKDSIPAIAALFMAVILQGRGLRLIPESGLARLLLAVYVASPVATALTNAEPVAWGSYVLPGLGLREAFGSMLAQILALLPFLLARSLLAAPGDQRDLLAALAIGGLAYSLPMLLELRLSPQLNIWIYGYFQHVFGQMVRGDGFRPIVFLYHALWVAFFTMTAVVAAAALARGSRGRGAALWLWAAVYLLVVLILCKSFAAIFYALLLLPFVAVAGLRTQLRLAVLLAAVALAYPVAKASQLVPEQEIVAAAARLGEDRAQSLRFRFDNEAVLAARAYEKPLFGWGQWGRNQILEEHTGRILTVTDGRWIILLGVFGWVGFIAEFGLLTLPLFLLWWRMGALAGSEAARWAGAVALILAVNVVDLLPNATLTPLSWMAAGALLGLAEALRRRPALQPDAGGRLRPAPPGPAPIRTVL